tara:strand:- start:119 stop:409 length:291 start_codon:yes stop_codon:yes gene_type:complete
MAIFDNIVGENINFKGYTGNPPTNEAEYDALDCWTDKSKVPSWASVSSDMALEKIKKDRKETYPSVGDQLDDLYHKGAFSAEMTATLKKVKDDNPK